MDAAGGLSTRALRHVIGHVMAGSSQVHRGCRDVACNAEHRVTTKWKKRRSVKCLAVIDPSRAQLTQGKSQSIDGAPLRDFAAYRLERISVFRHKQSTRRHQAKQ